MDPSFLFGYASMSWLRAIDRIIESCVKERPYLPGFVFHLLSFTMEELYIHLSNLAIQGIYHVKSQNLSGNEKTNSPLRQPGCL
jgi:hypothetical protein